MKTRDLYLLILLTGSFMLNLSCDKSWNTTDTRSILFDDNWRFAKGDIKGAEMPDFDDTAWRQLDLPHDWSIEDLPGQSADSIIGPFTKASVHKMRTGYTIGGTAWYRKNFTVKEQDSNRIVYLSFDGVYMNSDVWINGRHVGNHPYGYTSFYYDITPYLNPAGEENVVAVQVKNEGENARWYSGSGIYRHTWLTIVDPVHIEMNGIFIQTPEVSKEKATVTISSSLVNKLEDPVSLEIEVEIIDPDGNSTGMSEMSAEMKALDKMIIDQELEITGPALWSTESPHLHTARIKVYSDKVLVDQVNTHFGIRTIEFSAEKGFLLNGDPMVLAGGCFHHDNGPLGSKAIDRAEERKIEIFKEAGYNAIRCSHNPPSPYLLDVCDRLGMLVINEIFDNWEDQKISENDYSKYFREWWKKDVESWILRDRNHPSVIMWSIGNEIFEALDTIDGYRIAKYLTDAVRELDKSRAVTEAFNDFGSLFGRKSFWHESAPHLKLLDVVGYNYMYNRYEGDHEKNAERVMYASEFMGLFALENWNTVEDYPWVIGNFTWTVMDYLGEAGVGVSRYLPTVLSNNEGLMELFQPDSWPVFNSFTGDIDLIGNKKPQFEYQEVVWRKRELTMMVHEPSRAGLHEFVSPWGWPDELMCWNWEGHEGEPIQVNVYTRSPKVTLELNGKLLGEKEVDGRTSLKASFDVPFEPGTLIARSYSGDNLTGSDTIITAGKAAAVRLVADRCTIKADRNDLAYVMAEIVDAEGRVIPNADKIIVRFKIDGNAEIAGVASGSPDDMASFVQPESRTWHGKCLAIVRPLNKESGKVSLTAMADGLESSTVEITMK